MSRSPQEAVEPIRRERAADPAPASAKRRSLPWLRIIAVAIAVTGWWISTDLLRVSAGQQATIGLIAKSCGVTAGGISPCLSVLGSPQASIGGGQGGRGIPWAAIGAGYFGFVAAWFALVGRVSHNRWAWHLLMLLTMGLGAYHSVWFLQVMAFELRQWCAGCVAAHACNFVLLGVLLAQFPSRKAWPRTTHPSFALGAATVLCGWLLILLHVSVTKEMMLTERAKRLGDEYLRLTADADLVRLRHARQPLIDVGAIEQAARGGGAASEGPPDAPHTLVIFSDFQCPSCRELHLVVRELLRRFPGALRVQYHHFPLDTACNPHVPTRAHPLACQAAAAAEAVRAAAGLETHLKYRDLLYERRDQLPANRYAEWAAELGVTRDAFEAALGSATVNERIRADADLGHRLGVTTTPMAYLDCRRLEFWRSEAFWNELLGGAASAPAP
jgi:uncharacterized membrane protein/predicted DsbA family dithiol-disulfide isomerase